MPNSRCTASFLALLLALGVTACSRGGNDSSAGVMQTKFPGEITAGGGTSGENLHLTTPATSGAYKGGTPGIAGGAGGNTGGAATGGTVHESGHGPATPGGAGAPATPNPSTSGSAS